MAIVKRINLNEIERSMNKTVEISSNISFLQQELSHIKTQLENNEGFLSKGVLSEQAYEGNKRNFKKRWKDVVREVNEDIEFLVKLSNSVKRGLKSNKL
jgi:hypothetical protein